MGQANRKLDDETKKSIKRAVWRTHSLLPHLSPSEYVDSLFRYVEDIFLLEECIKKPFISGCSPDIVVKGKCVIEVSNAAVFGSARDRIKQYVKALSLAGAQVHFQPNRLPKIYWFYLDLADEVHVESVIGETLYSEPVNEVQRQGETDNFAAGVGIGLGILGAVAAGVLAYNAVSGTKNKEEEEKKEKRDAGVGIGLGILGAVAAGVLAYNAVSGTKNKEEEEEKEKRDADGCLAEFQTGCSYDGNLESPMGKTALRNYTVFSNRNSVQPQGFITSESKLENQMGKNSRKKYTFPEVYDIIKESAAKAKRNVITPADQYRDYRHNQYLKEFCSILHNELHSKGVPFEKEKKFFYEGRLIIPDIYIKDIAVVEIKARNQLNSGGKEQVQKYVAATGLPGIFVNFRPNGDPYIRIFYVEE